jgi:hypothetical protein
MLNEWFDKSSVGWCLAAWRGSRGLAHHSTARYVPGLNFRVRYGSGCLPRAVAAKTNVILILAVSCLSLDFALECDVGFVVSFWRVGCLVVAG